MRYRNLQIPFSLKQGEIHIWIINLNDPKLPINKMLKSLDFEEIKRAENFYYNIDKENFITRHWVLRKLLSSYTGMPSENLNISKNIHGKPFLPEQSIVFNISFSNTFAAMAFGKNRRLGLDIELVNPMNNLQQMINTSYSTKEKELVAGEKNIDLLESFFNVWTQKEALIKAIGCGFEISPKDISVQVNPLRTNYFLRMDHPKPFLWRLFSGKLENGLRFSICTEKYCRSINYRRFTFPT